MDAFDGRLALLNMGYARDNEKWNFGPICSNFSRLYLVTRGTACVRINGLEHKLTPGHMYLIPELTTHWDSSDGCFEHYYIHFVDPQHRLMELYRQYELPLEIEATPDMETMVRSVGYDYQEFALKQPQPKTYDNLPGTMTMYKLFEKRSVGQKMRMNSLLQYLLSCFFIKGKRRSEVSDSRVARIVWQIERQLDKEIRLDRLAASVCLCKERLIRLFKEQTGMTPTEYIMARRISRAETLLLAHQYSIKEVAAMVGYRDQNYFCRCFKKIAGLTPTAFVRQNK